MVYLRVAGEASESPPTLLFDSVLSQGCARSPLSLLVQSPPQGGLPQTLEKWLPASIPPCPTLTGTTVSVGSLQGLPQGSRGHTANSSDAPAMPADLHWDGA